MSVFIRIREAKIKGSALRIATRGSNETSFSIDCRKFRSIPGSPFVYWVSDSVLELFGDLEPLHQALAAPRQGLTTASDFRFIRAWWEPYSRDFMTRWSLLAKGSSTSSYYLPLDVAMNWKDDGRECQAYICHRYPYLEGAGYVAKNQALYFEPGVVFPRRPHRRGAFSHIPPGVIFSDNSPLIACSREEHWAQLALLNSDCFTGLLHLLMPRGTEGSSQTLVYEAGYVGAVPVPSLETSDVSQLTLLARRGWSLRRSLDTCTEVSHAFVLPAMLQVDGRDYDSRFKSWSRLVASTYMRLKHVQSEIDELCWELYGLAEDDRRTIRAGVGPSDYAEDQGDTAEDAEEQAVADSRRLARELVSWAVGIVVGRFDVRLATGERDRLEEPDPFDRIPVCSAAMLTDDHGLPLREPPEGYPLAVSPMLVDDPGHDLDATARVRAVFDAIFDERADEWWTEVGDALGASRGEIGAWLSKGFFDYHLRTYSKSRRRAPILWPIGTSSGSYIVWLYAHQVTEDSLFQVLNDIVDPKVGLEQRRLTELIKEAGQDPSSSQRRAIDTQETLVGELRELRDGLEAVAPLWAPNLNDGIVIVLAPLWQLFAHHKPWARELKKHWDKLTTGDYDWANLAMRLWPERVIPKCAADRSLAIAHGLEDVFWVQDADNTEEWHPRPTPTISTDQLISERRNAAIKATLQQAWT